MNVIWRAGRIALAGILVFAMSGCVIPPWGYGHGRGGGDRGHHDRDDGRSGGDGRDGRGGRDGR